jgi:DNA-binding LacI/PurR family transcriptional regulator
MADVAQLAGVSNQTVSRVLNDSEHVRAETRARVLDAMRKLDYRPSSAARALVTGRSRMLGVVSFDTTLYGPASTLYAIEQAAHGEGYFVTVASLEALEPDSVLSALDRLRQHGADGVLVIAPLAAAAEALAGMRADLPMVAVEAGPTASVPFVAVDQRAGAIAATRHLLELGHATVHHLAGPKGWLEAEERVAGWREALQIAGATAHEPLVGDWSAGAGYELGRHLAGDPAVTAVFAANDQMALGLLRALRERGRDVPRDVSVVGFDDLPEAPYFMPPLTTVRQDFNELGRRSLHVLLGEIEGEGGPPARVTIPPLLIVRASTASASGAPASRPRL